MTSNDPTAPQDLPGVDPVDGATPDQPQEPRDAAPAEPPAEAPAPSSPEQQRVDLMRLKAEAALAGLDAQATRVSNLSGGLRFSTLQKTQHGLVSELRGLRAQPPDESVVQGVESVIERADRLAAALGPVVPAPGAFTNPGSLRQALIRGMILLAPAPLHLQIEFAPDFPLADGDPVALAARSHAINRAALGSLRRIQWETPGRGSLWFGDGEQRRVVTVSFDAQGKVELPPEFRQKHNPPGQGASRKTPAAARPPESRRPPRVELMGPPSPRRQRVELMGPPRPRVELMGPPSPFARQSQRQRSGERPRHQRGGAPAGAAAASGERSGQQPGAPRQDGQQRRGPRSGPPGSGAGRQGQATLAGNQGPRAVGPRPQGPRQQESRQQESRQQESRPQGPRRDQPPGSGRRDRDDRRERDDRPVRQGPRGGSGGSGGGGGFPANSMLADKLRAALAPVKAPPREAPPAVADVAPGAGGDPPASEKK